MTNTTAMHSEKPTNCTYLLLLSQQPGIRQKQQLSQKNQGLVIIIGGTSENKKSTRRRHAYEPAGLNIEPYHKKPKTVGANVLPLNHPLITNPQAQANNSKSWERDIFGWQMLQQTQRIPLQYG